MLELGGVLGPGVGFERLTESSLFSSTWLLIGHGIRLRCYYKKNQTPMWQQVGLAVLVGPLEHPRGQFSGVLVYYCAADAMVTAPDPGNVPELG